MPKLHRIAEGYYAFKCPGCEELHGITVTSGDNGLGYPRPVWGWNNSVDLPTFTPSILAEGTKRCHSFVTGGKIEFLADSSHKLAGQTVEIPEWDGFGDGSSE